MASERQIAANRRNAQKSTGPRSQSGKKRSGRNAHRHGLAVPMSRVGLEAQVKDLVRQFAVGADDAKILALAEIAAHAQLDLARVRKAHTALIERALMTDALGDAEDVRSDLEELHQLVNQSGRPEEMRGKRFLQPELIGPLIPLPKGEADDEERFAKAIRHILSELTKISRYEKRAAGRRDRAIGKIVKRRGQNKL